MKQIERLKTYFDLSGYDEDRLLDHIMEEYVGCAIDTGQTNEESQLQNILEKYEFLIALEDEGGYEGESFFFLKDRKTGDFYANYASHCSCMGFEGQWQPEKTDIEYVMSDNFTAYYNAKDFNREIKRHIITVYLRDRIQEEGDNIFVSLRNILSETKLNVIYDPLKDLFAQEEDDNSKMVWQYISGHYQSANQ